jgi:hypothetical protein
VETKISLTPQHDLFDIDMPRLEKFPAVCHQDIETLLTQLLIQALQTPSVIQNQENSHASENQAEPFGKNCLSVSSPIKSATTA